MSDVWAEYEKFRSDGEIYTAVTRLAALENVLFSGTLEISVEDRWRDRIRNENFSSKEMQTVVHRSKAAAERLQRILDVAGSFQYEELMLLLTLRIELELVNDLFTRRTGSVAVEMKAVDDEIFDVAQSKTHSSTFAKAQVSVRRNWGLPIQTRWTRGGVQH